MLGLLLLVALALVGYAVITQYRNTDKSQPVLKRVWAAVVLAAMSVGGYITATVMQWAGQ